MILAHDRRTILYKKIYVFAIILVIIMSGCGRSILNEDSKYYIYQIPVPVGEYVNLAYSDGILLASGTEENTILFYTYDFTKNEWSSVPYTEDSLVIAMMPTKDYFWIIGCNETTDSTIFYIKKVSYDGIQTLNTKVSEKIEYISSIKDIKTDTHGNLYILVNSEILIYSSGGEIISNINLEESDARLAVLNDGRVAVESFTNIQYTNRSLIVFDMDEPTTIEYDYTFNDSSFYPSNGVLYNLNFFNDKELLGYDIEKDKTTSILSWLDFPIEFDYITHCYALGTGDFFISTNTILSNKSIQELFLVSTNNNMPNLEGLSGDSEKTIITLGTLQEDNRLSYAIRLFNISNKHYKVEIVNYSNGDLSSEQAATRLNTEIISGNAPDIFDLNGLSANNLAIKGCLLNLSEYITDKKSSNDYLNCVFDALQINENYYSIAPAFYLLTTVGKRDDVGDGTGWTIDEFYNLVESYPNRRSYGNLGSSDFLYYMVTGLMDNFVDWQSGICDFTGDEFVLLLKTAGDLPTSPDYSYDAAWLIQREDASLAFFDRADKSSILLYDAFLSGEESFIGFPTSDGTKGSYIMPIIELGISSNSSQIDGALAFFDFLLSDECQQILSAYFPVKLSNYEEKLSDLGHNTITYSDEYGNIEEADNAGYVIVDSNSGDTVQFFLQKLTQEVIDRLDNAIRSSETVFRPDSSIMEIILDEAGYYFSGEKTAAETAELIQSRVSTYVNEAR